MAFDYLFEGSPRFDNVMKSLAFQGGSTLRTTSKKYETQTPLDEHYLWTQN